MRAPLAARTRLCYANWSAGSASARRAADCACRARAPAQPVQEVVPQPHGWGVAEGEAPPLRCAFLRPAFARHLLLKRWLATAAVLAVTRAEEGRLGGVVRNNRRLHSFLLHLPPILLARLARSRASPRFLIRTLNQDCTGGACNARAPRAYTVHRSARARARTRRGFARRVCPRARVRARLCGAAQRARAPTYT
jgi:hypothetical protein